MDRRKTSVYLCDKLCEALRDGSLNSDNNVHRQALIIIQHSTGTRGGFHFWNEYGSAESVPDLHDTMPVQPSETHLSLALIPHFGV